MFEVPRFKVSPHRTVGRPTAYVLPRPVDIEDLASIGARLVQLIGHCDSQLLHLIAIAKSGYPMTVAAALQIRQAFPDLQVYVSGVDPYALLNTFDDVPPCSSILTIMVDNAVKTGQTAVQSMKVAAACGIEVNRFIKLIDYSDRVEQESTAYIRSAFPSISISSLYTADEISRRM